VTIHSQQRTQKLTTVRVVFDNQDAKPLGYHGFVARELLVPRCPGRPLQIACQIVPQLQII
jgi:hypothetical protein